MNLEQQVADTLLQRPLTVRIGEREYTAAPPTLATLIEVSSLIATLPQERLNPEDIATESLRIAKHCSVIGEIIALLINGASASADRNAFLERYTEPWPEMTIFQRMKYGFSLKRFLRKNKISTPSEQISGAEILRHLSPTEASNLLAQLLQSLNLGDFFALTTFLLDINLTRRTKVENNATTAPGPSSLE